MSGRGARSMKAASGDADTLLALAGKKTSAQGRMVLWQKQWQWYASSDPLAPQSPRGREQGAASAWSLATLSNAGTAKTGAIGVAINAMTSAIWSKRKRMVEALPISNQTSTAIPQGRHFPAAVAAVLSRLCDPPSPKTARTTHLTAASSPKRENVSTEPPCTPWRSVGSDA